jgi:hypothetical protein
MIFKTIIGILNGETENVRRVCEDIKKRDGSFSFEIFKPTVPELSEKFENLLVLYSSSRDAANRRGGWFKHKCRNAKLGSYFWVKEF